MPRRMLQAYLISGNTESQIWCIGVAQCLGAGRVSLSFAVNDVSTPELFRSRNSSLICNYCSPRSLANLAQTSSFFAEPALDALWANHRQLISTLLSNVLPTDAVTLTSHESYSMMEPFHSETGHLAVEPTDEQWDRVASYGARMRTVWVSYYLHKYSSIVVHFSPDLISMWMLYSQRRKIGPALCPNAKALIWHIADPSAMAQELALY
ncbi:hypothetical protein BD626DRAFT_572127 [Schizophyllum amplum]|uniref:Uncharacterized protein n=1 Tax=Schizophyllum amplum TaxID=97359 RepID=A0A550C5F1_9AGAR|nr:hypothetical protein BD626DRAFT_572127 [Auriculariopsis ampla]